MFSRWWGFFVTPEPRHAARVPYPRPSFPIIVWDEPVEEPDTDKTEVAGLPCTVKFDPPRAAVAPGRLRAVVVRVTGAEWVRLGREAGMGQDLGDVLRGWAGLPSIPRRKS
jgi:hypothetical protein